MQLRAGNGAAAAAGTEAGSTAEVARLEKHLKGRLAAAAEHFNRDFKKGFQYLQVGCAVPLNGTLQYRQSRQ